MAKTKRRKVWVSFFDDGEHWAFTSRKDALDVSNEAASEKAVRFIEARPGDVVLSREDAEKVRALIETVECAFADGDDKRKLRALLRGAR